MLRPLDYPAPQQLVRITSELRGFGATDTGVAPAELVDYQSRTDLFTAVAGVVPTSANVTGGDTPARVEMMLVSWTYFSVLGVAPAHGRVFAPGGRCAWCRQRRRRERRVLAAESEGRSARPSARRS